MVSRVIKRKSNLLYSTTCIFLLPFHGDLNPDRLLTLFIVCPYSFSSSDELMDVAAGDLFFSFTST